MKGESVREIPLKRGGKKALLQGKARQKKGREFHRKGTISGK